MPGGESLKKPSYAPKTRMLSLNYPPTQYRVRIAGSSAPNGHVWADLHTGVQRAR
ncbi:hypothetical protein NVV93_15455 [Pseudomonas sp. LS44]|uniref:hypothetical protein n=1 Tax=Pseudomonas sp. LS44 TaxID=1357074 RepID=UPI00215A336C|nr:hypothetical protein [Pseudomonas sp. LS44]UVE16975.1 hypothetical protein NVV93_15455 [Pseudomonas sp. LS44]